MSIEKENVIEKFKEVYYKENGVVIDDIIKNKTPIQFYCTRVSKNYLKTYFNISHSYQIAVQDVSSYLFKKNFHNYVESKVIPYFIINSLIPREELTVESFIELFSISKKVYESGSQELTRRAFIFTKLNLYSSINSDKGLRFMYFTFLRTLSGATTYGTTDILNANFLYNIRAELEYLQLIDSELFIHNTRDYLDPSLSLYRTHIEDIVNYDLKPILKEFYEAGVLFDSTKSLYELLKYAEK